MERIIEIKLLKKINFIKGLILIVLDDDADSEVLNSFEQLFKIELDAKLIFPTEITNHIKSKNHIDALNCLNLWKDKISKKVFQYPCDRVWSDLIKTEDNSVRFCSGCTKNVYKVSTLEELQKRTNLQQCIAIDEKFHQANTNKMMKSFQSCNLIIKEDFELIGLPMCK